MEHSLTRPAYIKKQAKTEVDPEFAAFVAAATSTSPVWGKLLSEFELKSLMAYRRQWPNRAFSLNQNGDSSHAMHSSEECHHTLIRNAGLIWSDILSEGRASIW